MKNEIILFEDQEFKLEVNMKDDTVWLNSNQIADLFERDVKTIRKHINNALNEELLGESVVAKFATTGSDGKTYQVEHYNLEMISSVGYRVKSKRWILFRRWANKVLKEYLSINNLLYKDLNYVIDNNTLAALTILIAQSNPKEKDVMIDLINNFLVTKHIN